MPQLGPFVMMVAVATQVVGPVIAPIREAPLDRLLRLVGKVAGPGARSCGRFLLQEFGRPPASLGELTAASECIEQSRSERVPAWVVIQQQGIDSWVAYGLVLTREGGVHAFSFDSDPSGGSGVAPRFSTTPCSSIHVSEDAAGWAQLGCREPA